MMKVHSMIWRGAVAQEAPTSIVRSIVRSVAVHPVSECFVLDGPFAETKESCPHVVILARLMNDPCRPLSERGR